MTLKTAIGFITYYPEDSFYIRLEELVENEKNIFLFDNSKNPKKSIDQRINYYTENKNMGLGFGMKIICKKAYESGYDSLIFFDQDTVFSLNTIQTMESFFKFNQIVLLENYTSAVFDSTNFLNKQEIDFNNYKNIQISRNSGSLFILKNMKKIGWHNSSYFVDGVDYEYNLNSLINNYNIAYFSYIPDFDHISEQGYNFNSRFIKFREYNYKRIMDYFFSSIRLLFKSMFNGKIVFSLKIFYQLVVYTFSQLLIRILRLGKFK